MLHEEVVARRRWMSDQHFLDLLGATNLLPGPNSTEMVIHTGYEQSRLKGMLIAGLCFILPASAITLAFAWLYLRYGSTPAGSWLLYGVKPVVIAVIVSAIWSLARTAVRSAWVVVLGAAVVGLALLGLSELALLFGAGLLAMAVANRDELLRRLSRAFALVPIAPAALAPVAATLAASPAEPYSAWTLFLLFLRIGATLYGSGYVLIAFIQADLVGRLGWLTDEQLIDAVAVGQFTPGPVSSTATFVGYLVGGWWGALLATIGIFLPAFVVVALFNPLVPKLRRSVWAGGFLDGVNVGALGLMVAVAWTLGRSSVIDPITTALTAGSLLALVLLRVNSVWLILGGAAVGLLVNWWLLA
jgi:chromate transporter